MKKAGYYSRFFSYLYIRARFRYFVVDTFHICAWPDQGLFEKRIRRYRRILFACTNRRWFGMAFIETYLYMRRLLIT
ncbi:hypothetical protein D3Z39_12655 [Anaerotruncus colihominis]|uniref:Uncharacterized protein n=1 Tax=Anaerotruncus colihominis TaxID=169435 RepID=A0A845RLQ5_9FIRM|nr:hypothetical protein [Anaerotruncus colihominis]